MLRLMIKKVITVLFQILLISSVLYSSYYFFYLKPKAKSANDIVEAEKVLIVHKNILTQNRIAYLGLTKLDSKSPSFSVDASNLIATLETTQKEGLENINTQNTLPKTKIISTDVFSDLLSRTGNVYKSQGEILNKIRSTKTYKDGLEILRSTESVNAITDQTNLILEYEGWIEKLKYTQ